MELPSRFQVNDKVEIFTEDLGLTEGQVMAVKFTESKVLYDVYSPRTAIFFEGVLSDNVSAPEAEAL